MLVGVFTEGLEPCRYRFPGNHRWNSTSMRAFISIIISLCGLSLFAVPPTPDFAAAHEETIRILTSFVRVDTSNPPGNETKGADYLKAFLDREGVASEIFELEKGRGNLVARV